MANALFEIESGLRIGDNYWFTSNGNIITTGTIVAGNIQVTGSSSVTNVEYENVDYLETNNFSTGNAAITGGQTYIGGSNANRIANIYATLADISSNVLIGQNLFIGPSASSKALSTPTIVAIDNGSAYAQMAMINSAGTGSSDYAAYSSTGNDAGGWVDMGIAGETFNDGSYTITKPNDSYLFARPLSNTYGGNLVLATSEAGSYNDMVFAVGAFHANAEVARFHGNISTTGYLNLGYTKQATSATSAALVVAGGVGVTNGLYVNGTSYLQQFSAGNIYQAGGSQSIQTANLVMSGGSIGTTAAGVVSAIANIFATNATFTSLQASNVAITGGNIGMGYNRNVSLLGNVYASTAMFTNLGSGNILMSGDITQSTTGTFSYSANTLPPKQYVDVMAVVFGN